jgi:hypothetical protein
MSRRLCRPAPGRAYRGRMGVLGEMFPGSKIADEAGEAGDGERPWRLGPIDLDNNVVQLHRPAESPAEGDSTED